MNIKGLKELIKDLPDEMEFLISHDGNMNFESYPADPEIQKMYVFDYKGIYGRVSEKVYHEKIPESVEIKNEFEALVIKTCD